MRSGKAAAAKHRGTNPTPAIPQTLTARASRAGCDGGDGLDDGVQRIASTARGVEVAVEAGGRAPEGRSNSLDAKPLPAPGFSHRASRVVILSRSIDACRFYRAVTTQAWTRKDKQ